MVDDIYALMTRRAPVEPKAAAVPMHPLATPLQRVGINLMAGLMEALAAPPYDGRADLPALAAPLHYEVDDLLPLGETLQLLHFAVLEEGDIYLTEKGRAFVPGRCRRPSDPVHRGLAGICPAGEYDPSGSGRAMESPGIGGSVPRRT